MRPLLATLAALALLAPEAALAAPIAVTVRDRGHPALCAEEDNVYATLAAPGVRRFEAIARRPAYGAALTRDNQAPDFTACHFTAARDFTFKPRTVTLYRGAKVMVKGVVYPRYWRPEQVEVDVAGHRDRGLHLLQLFVMDHGRWQETLVLHLADGYWRLRPLPEPRFKSAVYGSSFLIGPIEESTRPFVRIASVTVDPKAMTLTATFLRGGAATIAVTRLDRRELRLKVRLDPPVAGGPFLALRSMYVAPDNADTAEIHWRDPSGAAKTRPAIGFGTVKATALGFRRRIPSRHNTSAPDIVLKGFEK
jgi:hypothetical protein